MMTIKVRFGGNGGAVTAGLLPAPLPSLSSAFSRRAALFGAVTATGFLGAATVPRIDAGIAGIEAGSADARLEAIADEMHAVKTACDTRAAAHHGRWSDATEAEFDQLSDRFGPLEEEMADLQADTLAGVLAKLRALDIPTCRESESGIADSACADLRRLHAAGVFA